MQHCCQVSTFTDLRLLELYIDTPVPPSLGEHFHHFLIFP